MYRFLMAIAICALLLGCSKSSEPEQKKEPPNNHTGGGYCMKVYKPASTPAPGSITGQIAGPCLEHVSMVVVVGTQQKSTLKGNGTFILKDVPPGTYILKILPSEYFFDNTIPGVVVKPGKNTDLGLIILHGSATN